MVSVVAVTINNRHLLGIQDFLRVRQVALEVRDLDVMISNLLVQPVVLEAEDHRLVLQAQLAEVINNLVVLECSLVQNSQMEAVQDQVDFQSTQLEPVVTLAKLEVQDSLLMTLDA